MRSICAASSVVPDDLDGHGCKVGIHGGKCAPVSEAHSNLAGSCVHCGDRYEYTEILDAGDERLVELRVGADVYVDEQAAWIELGSGDGRPRPRGRLGDGHV